MTGADVVSRRDANLASAAVASGKPSTHVASLMLRDFSAVLFQIEVAPAALVSLCNTGLIQQLLTAGGAGAITSNPLGFKKVCTAAANNTATSDTGIALAVPPTPAEALQLAWVVDGASCLIPVSSHFHPITVIAAIAQSVALVAIVRSRVGGCLSSAQWPTLDSWQVVTDPPLRAGADKEAPQDC